jgi:YidC/Oxa1 family membrane protein insertase
MMENNRNTFIAIALSALIVLAWQFFYMNPRIEAQRKAQETAKLQQKTEQVQTPAANGQAQPAGATPPAGGPASPTTMSRDQALAKSQRVTIDTDALSGSIDLTSARIDDLRLKRYRETVDKDSPIITLLSPADTADAYFAELGYIGNDQSGSVPGPSTQWTVSAGDKLTEKTPITLTYTNEKGVTFTRTISVDENYMFTFDDKISNAGQQPVSLSAYGRVTRNNKPVTPSTYVLHEGFIGVLDNALLESKYAAVEKENVTAPQSTGGWLGITDKYWAATLIPPQNSTFDARFSHFTDGTPRFQADYRAQPFTVGSGQSVDQKNLVFAGAKVVPVIDNYKDSYSIPRFDRLIDWGWFYFITKPMFRLMDFFFHFFGNFGVAILCTTIVVKVLFFPLASKQYASMANMKRMQPKMEELKAKFGDDKMGLQQATMQLYKDEKINPVAGCWPIALQIPIFFSLYKVIYITIEMRHAPFFGWIRDLSAPDPTSFVNLFGLLPFAAPAFLHLGVWPLIMGVTMFLQMRMNPTPPDPTQAMLFNWMPLVFTFMLSSFPAGLVIYWAWNNTLSVIQQSIIMKRHGVKVELFHNLKGLFRRKPAPSK